MVGLLSEEKSVKRKLVEVTWQDYFNYLRSKQEVVIEDQVIKLMPLTIERLTPTAEELTDVTTTVWSFPKRGSWATHKGDYRGNWAPQIPRALILMYTRPGDVVLDQMVGSGTTCIEARLLGRNCIGVDINYEAAILSLHRLYYLEEYAKKLSNKPSTLTFYVGVQQDEVLESVNNVLNTWTKIYHGDARNLDKIEDESVDLIATHPPYWGIIKYGRKEGVEGDLSKVKDLQEYLRMIKEVADEAYRVLKPGRYCAILIGDTRIHKHYVPITHHVLKAFLDAGFILKEEVIKIQHKMKVTRELWNRLKERDFLLIYHEKLLIFRKPHGSSDIKQHVNSTKILW